jgi:hypothetical protein
MMEDGNGARTIRSAQIHPPSLVLYYVVLRHPRQYDNAVPLSARISENRRQQMPSC